jgi:hypothetical protein
MPGRVERYAIERSPGRLALKMRQATYALGVAAVSLGVLLLSWAFGPHGPRPTDFAGPFYWVWSSFWGIVLGAALLGAAYREDWTITGQETVVTTSFAGRRRQRRVSTAPPLGIRVEHRTGAGESRSIYPWRIHVLDDRRNDSGLCLLFRRRESVDRMLDALRTALAVDARTVATPTLTAASQPETPSQPDGCRPTGKQLPSDGKITGAKPSTTR